MAKNLKQHIRSHYEFQHLDAALLSELCNTVTANTGGRAARSTPLHRWQFFAGMSATAAVILLAAIPFIYRAGRHAGLSQADIQANPGSQSSRRAGTESEPPALVAVRFHADWCPRSPQIVPIFDRVRRDYGMSPILLVTMDLTDDVTRHQSEQLAEALGVQWILKEGIHTGTIALVDRKAKETLALVSDPEDWPTLVTAVGRNLRD